MKTSKLLAFACLLGLMLVQTGCDTSPKSDSEIIQADPTLSALSKVGHMYHMHHDIHGQGPADWDGLKSVAGQMSGDEQEYLDAVQHLQDNGYDLKWGMKFSQVTGGMTQTVLAQSAQKSEKLMFDGSVSK